MKFNVQNKLFYIIILTIVLLCLGISLFTRASISIYNYENFLADKDKYLYYPYEDLRSSGGVYSDIDYNENIDSNTFSDYIIEGIATGNHEILEGAVLTEVRVDRVIKGDINKDIIYIYEPVSISVKDDEYYMQSMCGYGLIRDNKKYILCIDSCGTDNRLGADIKENYYVYKNPLLSKFSVEYKECEYEIVENSEDYKGSDYKKLSNYEQVFDSDKSKSLYLNFREQLIK